MSNSRSIKRLLSKWSLCTTPAGYQELHTPTHSPPLSPKRSLEHHHPGLSDFLYEENPAPHCSLFLKKCKTLVPVVAGKDEDGSKVFVVETHILEHWLFQDLVQMSLVQTEWGRQDWNAAEIAHGVARRKKADLVRPMYLDCDAVLFEFFLWLVEKDDPSLRDLNLNDLMEFYDAEA